MSSNHTEVNEERNSLPAFWLAIVTAVALLVRVVTLLIYQPVAFSDTPSYRRLAEAVLQGFTSYDGTRTPGYPVFLALVGSDQRVWLAQLFLGLITTLLFFYIGWKLTDKPWFAGVVGLAHTLNLGQLFFESNLLTESLTTFLVVLTMAGVLYWLINPLKRRLWLAFALGLISSCTLLVRPLFIYLPFITLLALWLSPQAETGLAVSKDGEIKPGGTTESRLNMRHRLMGLVFLVPVAGLLGGWVAFIHAQFGDWSLTTMTGYHLVQHTGSYFEYVPDEYASLRDVYIRYRDAHIAQYGTQTNTIWEAIPEMSRVSGNSFYGLSRVLTRISVQLIVQHPWLYLKNVISGWWMFWRTAVYWSADALRLPWMAGGIQLAIQVERAVLLLSNLVFIFASVAFVFTASLSALRHNQGLQLINIKPPTRKLFIWTLLGTIWIASVVQTLLDHGDNPRFLVPLQSLVVLCVTVFIFQFARDKLQRANTPHQGDARD
ncbi:MAG: hypothetical protein ACM3H7_08275 [Acidobacteriaceae bacterium]